MVCFPLRSIVVITVVCRIFVLAVLFIVNAAITMVSFVAVLLVFSSCLQLGSRSSRYHWERIDKLNTNQVVSRYASHAQVLFASLFSLRFHNGGPQAISDAGWRSQLLEDLQFHLIKSKHQRKRVYLTLTLPSQLGLLTHTTCLWTSRLLAT